MKSIKGTWNQTPWNHGSNTLILWFLTRTLNSLRPEQPLLLNAAPSTEEASGPRLPRPCSLPVLWASGLNFPAGSCSSLSLIGTKFTRAQDSLPLSCGSGRHSVKTRCRAEPGAAVPQNMSLLLCTRARTQQTLTCLRRPCPAGDTLGNLEVHGVFPLVVQDGGKKRTREPKNLMHPGSL